MATKTDAALGALIKRYRENAGLTQAAVAELLRAAMGRNADPKPTQGLVASNEAGHRWNLDLPGIYARVLRIPGNEMRDVVFDIDSGPSDGPPTWRETIESDPSLSAAAKEHLINQYGLLQLASQAERAANRSADKHKGTRDARRNG